MRPSFPPRGSGEIPPRTEPEHRAGESRQPTTATNLPRFRRIGMTSPWEQLPTRFVEVDSATLRTVVHRERLLLLGKLVPLTQEESRPAGVASDPEL